MRVDNNLDDTLDAFIYSIQGLINEINQDFKVDKPEKTRLKDMYRLIFSGPKTILINKFTNEKTMVTFKDEYYWDTEKAVLYALLKAQGIGAKEIEELIRETSYLQDFKPIDNQKDYEEALSIRKDCKSRRKKLKKYMDILNGKEE